MPIPYNFTKIKDSIESSANSAVKKTGEFIETSKLNFEISGEEREIENLYKKIGERIYKQYEKNKPIDSNLVRYCKEIKEIKHKIMDIRKKITKIQDKKICPLCGKEIENNAVYCEHCGFKQKNRKNSSKA